MPGHSLAERIKHPVIIMSVTTLCAFLLYLRTTAPTVLPGDSGEFQFAAWGFWLAHPTGYPLYLLLGGAWQHLLPVGDPAFRLNLFSGLCSALAVGLTYPVMLQVSSNRGAALIGTLAFAVSSSFWSQATAAEVYALNTLLIVALSLLAFEWDQRRQFKYAAGLALVFGLALAHHRTIILLLPAFVALLTYSLLAAWRRTGLRLALTRVAQLGALAALPLLLYLYIPLRAPATPYATLTVTDSQRIVAFEDSPRGWLGVILGERFQNELRLDRGSLDAARELPGRLAAEFNPLGAALGILGILILLAQRRFALAAFILFGFLSVTAFNGLYHIGDIRDYYTPAYWFFALGLTAAAGAILEFLRQHVHLKDSTIPSIALLGLIALVPLENLSTTFVEHDRSLEYETRARWETLIAGDLPARAILVSNDRDEMTPLWYLQLVEQVRPDLLGLFPKVAQAPSYANIVALVSTIIRSGRPVYTIKSLPILYLKYQHREAANGMEEILNAPLPPPQVESPVVVGNTLGVVGYSVLRGTAAVGETITLGVQFHPLRPLARDFATSIQLFDSNGEKVAQGDDHLPGAPDYGMTHWRVGEIIQDRFEMQINPNLAPGDYWLFVRVYDQETGEDVGELTELGVLRIEE